MTRRLLTLLGVLTVAVAAALTLAVPVAGQAQNAAGKTYTPPRTPWGDPDLQGIYNIATSTPLQRPAALGEKVVLTEEEAAQFQEEVAENLTRDRRDGGAQADLNRAYNDHWMDAKRLLITQDRRTSLIVDPPDGRIPTLVPLSPERQQRRDAAAAGQRRFIAGMPWGPEETANAFRCIIRTDRPPYQGIIYNNTYQIFQSPGYVVILAEMIHSARIIPVDGRPHIGKNIGQWLGDTRGRWESNTLVLETTNYRDDSVTFGNANPDTYRLTERLTRIDAKTIKYEFSVADPQTWSRPWTAWAPWNKTEDQLYEYACHEDNYDMVHLLAGGREREKRGETVDTASRAAGGEER